MPPAVGPMRLTLRLEPALEHGIPNIELSLNGKALDTFAVSEPREKSWVLEPRSDGWNEVALASDRFVNPLQEGISPDGRDLSVRLLGYDWTPVTQ